jgi:hypothetical protein
VTRVLKILDGIKSGKVKFTADSAGRRAMDDAITDVAEVVGGMRNARGVARDAIGAHLRGDSGQLDDLIRKLKDVVSPTRTNNAERNRLAAQPGAEASVFEAIARRQGSRRVREAQGNALMRGSPPAPRNLAQESASVRGILPEGGKVDRVGARTAARKEAIKSRYQRILAAIGKEEPTVRRELEALRDAGMDISKIRGTGPKGRIEMRDIKAFAGKTPPSQRMDNPGPSVNPQNEEMNASVRAIRDRIRQKAGDEPGAESVLARARFSTSMGEYSKARNASERTQVPGEIRAVRRLDSIEKEIAKIEAEIKKGASKDEVIKVSFKTDDTSVAEPRTLVSRRDRLAELNYQRKQLLDEMGPGQRELVNEADRALRESNPRSGGLKPGREARAIQGAINENVLVGQGAERKQKRISFLESALRGDNDDYVIRDDDSKSVVKLKEERIRKAKAELAELTKPSRVQFGNNLGSGTQGIPKVFDPNPRRPVPVDRPNYLTGRNRGKPISSLIRAVEENRNRRGPNPLAPKKKRVSRTTELQRARRAQGGVKVESRISQLIRKVNDKVKVD